MKKNNQILEIVSGGYWQCSISGEGFTGTANFGTKADILAFRIANRDITVGGCNWYNA